MFAPSANRAVVVLWLCYSSAVGSMLQATSMVSRYHRPSRMLAAQCVQKNEDDLSTREARARAMESGRLCHFNELLSWMGEDHCRFAEIFHDNYNRSYLRDPDGGSMVVIPDSQTCSLRVPTVE